MREPLDHLSHFEFNISGDISTQSALKNLLLNEILIFKRS